MRARVVVLLGLVLVLVAGACAPATPAAPAATATPAAAQPQEIVLGLSLSTLNNPFFVTLKEGAERAAAQYGVKLIVVDAQDDPAKEAANIEDLIQKLSLIHI